MNRSALAVFLMIPCVVNAANMTCSVHPKQGASDSELAKLAKITQSDAEIAALKAVNIKAASIGSSELEAEGGCLIYSFDIRIPGRKAIVEVAVDAGSGKILAKKNEGPKAQAAEQAADEAAKR